MTLPDGTMLELFGAGGGAEVAAALSTADETVEVLASIPLSAALRSGGDSGLPVVVAHPEDAAAVAIESLASRLDRRPSRAGRQVPADHAPLKAARMPVA